MGTFQGAQGQPTSQSVVGSDRNATSSEIIRLSSLRIRLKKSHTKIKALKLVSHWDATISRLVGAKGLRHKRDFLPFFTLRSHWTL